MGTINYYTSNYITIGYNLNNIDYDFFDDDFISDDYNNIYSLLKKYNFYYFNVGIMPGYYEGFIIDIELNFGVCFDTYQDKKNALKEITQIKKFLIECIENFNLCAVVPSWCTTYYNYKDTVKKLNDAIKEMREDVSKTPTYKKLKMVGEI